jgi:hypothetical protein
MTFYFLSNQLSISCKNDPTIVVDGRRAGGSKNDVKNLVGNNFDLF